MLVSVREHAWPSVTVGLRRSKLVVLVDELGRIEGLGVGIEGVRVDVGRLRLLFSSSSFSMISPHISYRNVDLTASQIWSILTFITNRSWL